MAYLNKVMLIGNTGKDAEIRIHQQSGRKSASISLATSRKYRDNNGEQKEQTYWHNLIAYGKLADTIEQLRIAKGTQMYVEGVLTNRTWNDNQGSKRSITEIVLENFQLITARNTPQHQPTTSENNPYHTEQNEQTQNTDFEDDLHF